MLVSGMSFDPCDLYGIGSLCFNTLVEVLKQVTITNEFPIAFVVMPCLNVGYDSVGLSPEDFAVRSYVYRPVCAHGYDASCNLSSS